MPARCFVFSFFHGLITLQDYVLVFAALNRDVQVCFVFFQCQFSNLVYFLFLGTSLSYHFLILISFIVVGSVLRDFYYLCVGSSLCVFNVFHSLFKPFHLFYFFFDL